MKERRLGNKEGLKEAKGDFSFQLLLLLLLSLFSFLFRVEAEQVLKR